MQYSIQPKMAKEKNKKKKPLELKTENNCKYD